MLEDYSRYFLVSNPTFPRHLTNTDRTEGIAHLQAVIKERFPSIINERIDSEQHYPAIKATQRYLLQQQRERKRERVTAITPSCL